MKHKMRFYVVAGGDLSPTSWQREFHCSDPDSDRVNVTTVLLVKVKTRTIVETGVMETEPKIIKHRSHCCTLSRGVKRIIADVAKNIYIWYIVIKFPKTVRPARDNLEAVIPA